MMRRAGFLALGVLATALSSQPTRAADHRDGPAVTADPSTDINDLYTWMSADGKRVYLVMTVFPAANAMSKFSNAAYYVFHTASRMNFLATQVTPTDITCSFNQAQDIECWVGTDKANYVKASAAAAATPAGVSSKNGKIKVFAGLRDDPFFFNLDGFNAVRTAVKGAAAGLTFDANGCPTLNMATADALVNQLRTAPGGGAPQDFFRTLNTLAIVMEVDKTLLDRGGPILSVWAGTHRKN